ncbi:hypothetical protein RV14_GL000050 [Enterococcus ratti]|uniref:Uncharacterized protein n=1 Tax=Enterococcus ratti TaxID=150033 RepID=A0A1L8WSA1_9ENTE|nr:hypothetical protein RV14_GL000050 [Enterococcus ratti]
MFIIFSKKVARQKHGLLLPCNFWTKLKVEAPSFTSGTYYQN